MCIFSSEGAQTDLFILIGIGGERLVGQRSARHRVEVGLEPSCDDVTCVEKWKLPDLDLVTVPAKAVPASVTVSDLSVSPSPVCEVHYEVFARVLVVCDNCMTPGGVICYICTQFSNPYLPRAVSSCSPLLVLGKITLGCRGVYGIIADAHYYSIRLRTALVPENQN